MMYMELKKKILEWLMENENTWQRIVACSQAFREYIYDSEGKFLIGGADVAKFILDADKLLYGDRE